MSIASAPQQQQSSEAFSGPDDRKLILLAIALAFAARIAAMFLLRTWDFTGIYGPDKARYAFGNESGSIAYSLAAGHGFSSPFLDRITVPSAWIAPIYPALVAGIFKIFGAFTPAAAIASFAMNSAFSALTCIPLYCAGRRTVGRRVALWSMFLWALCPLFWRWAVTWVWDMCLSALLFTCAFWFALRLREGAGKREWAAFGALWGVCALVNPGMLIFSVVSALWAAWPQLRSPRGWLRTAILSGVVAVAVISPWLVRNRIALGHWVFVRDNFPFEFSLGNFHNSNGMGWAGMHPAVNPHLMAEYIQKGEVEFIRHHGALAMQFVREYPGEFLRLCAHRFIAFWDGEYILYSVQALEWWSPWVHGLLSLLTLVGAVFALSRRVTAAWMYTLGILLYPLPYYLTYPQTRYRHEVEPLMLLLTVYLFQQLWQEFRRARASQS